METVAVLFKKLSDKAVAPKPLAKTGDIGYDLTLVELESVKGSLYCYTTDLAVFPTEEFSKSYYLEVVPRSNFSKTGFVMGNSIGIIDTGYTGPIKAFIQKLNPESPNLVLPGSYFQVIVRPRIFAEFIEVKELPETDRGDNGFGSTGII